MHVGPIYLCRFIKLASGVVSLLCSLDVLVCSHHRLLMLLLLFVVLVFLLVLVLVLGLHLACDAGPAPTRAED